MLPENITVCMTEKDIIKTRLRDYNYIGWIPNTAGHVYFRHSAITEDRHLDYCNVQPPLFSFEEKEEKTRIVLLSSLFDLNDQPVKKGKAKFTRFIVSAKSINKGPLKGKLWMIWNNDPTQSPLEKNIVTQLKKLEEQAKYIKKIWAVETTLLKESNINSEKFSKNRRRARINWLQKRRKIFYLLHRFYYYKYWLLLS